MTTPDVAEESDVVVIGSGGAGLLAACVAADAGGSVTVVESTDRLGGTTAVSGGMIWAPGNPFMAELGQTDTRADALRYLDRVTEGAVPREAIELFLDTVAETVDYLVTRTPLRLSPIDRPDYHSEWPGARVAGRTLDVVPFPTADRPGLRDRVRAGAHFAATMTYDERHRWRWPGTRDEELLARRERDGALAVGAGLVAALVAAADDRGVRFRTGTRAASLAVEGGRVAGVHVDLPTGPALLRARRGVVLACGGFEWNDRLKRAFLREPGTVAVSPPGNRGDGLVMAMSLGAAVDSMAEGWWVPVVSDPDETYEGAPLYRHLVGERCLPGSIVVDGRGRRFVNEAVNYNDVTRALHAFDPTAHRHAHAPAWLVFDETFRRRYPVGAAQPHRPAPAWFLRGESLAALAKTAGIDPGGLEETVAAFNGHARLGVDPDFGRGSSAHDRYYGDQRRPGNPCLAPLEEPPFYAVELRSGMLGTRGGLRTAPSGEVLRHDGTAIAGLYACGNVAAGPMGPGYPGSGGTLAPALAGGYRCGRSLRATAEAR
ncbi:FAD-dependent oxidoreductase [Micromonospora okii]|uniref:FAD-dependent oxidoreductase n=1 Tax=Micromonospora okii TaxID=1182970 RepID=UPI001E415C5D|nr:FAD-dependent oxidoreductase [Micromonospora okii]